MALDAEPRSAQIVNIEAPTPVEPAPANDSDPVDARLGRKPQAAKPPEVDPALDDMVRRGDEDRWLASRFATRQPRRRLIALYAFNHELAGIAQKVSQPRLGEIRLQWWRDAVASIFQDGVAPEHPAARALGEVVRDVGLPLDLFDALLTARVHDLVAAPFETWSDLDAYIDATTGGLMRLAAQICVPDMVFTSQRLSALQSAARAWGYMELVRALPTWKARQRSFFPRSLRANVGLGDGYVGGEVEEAAIAFAAHAVLDRAIGAQKSLPRYVKSLPKEVFPAFGYSALTPIYIRAYGELELGRRVMRRPSLLLRQFRIVLAAATGGL